MKLNIAVGKSRHDKIWVNKEFTWEDFLKPLEKTTQTYETLNEYLALPPERQAEIKDVGGFVSGFLDKGRRQASSVAFKQILTLDSDDATEDFWDICRMQFGCAMAIYSTHKHQIKKPKYRLLIPLSREVRKDEYESICRKVCSLIGMDMFDHTCFRVNQLMYWPSTSKDGEYVFKQQVGPWMDPDEILDMYFDWQDISSWPLGSREKKATRTSLKLQGDPLSKPGLIGHFNNSYSISEAMDEFLPGVYEKSDIGGVHDGTSSTSRYTFLAGSTFGGVVVYDDKFIYSHHSTDPISGVLCNAFDMVRYHRFIVDDHDVKDSVPTNKRPSHLRMCDLAVNDRKVKRYIGEARLAGAKEAFADVQVPGNEVRDETPLTDLDEIMGDDLLGEVVEDAEWTVGLDADRKGNYLPTMNNIALILDNDPHFKGAIAFDEFQQQPVFKRDMPWRSIKDGKDFITDNDLANLENYVEKVYTIFSSAKFMKGLLVVLERNRFHPVRQYLRGLRWDGVPRIDTLMVDYLGAEDSVYTRAVTRKTLVAGVARVMKPGIKYDYVLTLVGKEGQGKSALWDKLGGAWFSDTFSMHMLQSKEAYEQIQGAWIVEIGELAGMAKAEIERVKSFFSARKDRYRSPYGRTTDLRPRQCIFVASTNRWDFLKSQSGNRRFWPIETHFNKPEFSVYSLTQDKIDQVWAEALYAYKKGESLYLGEELVATAVEIQTAYTEEDPWVEIFENFLSLDIPENWYNMSRFDKNEFMNNYEEQKEKFEMVKRDKVCKYELWEIALQKKEVLDTFNLRLIKQAMEQVKGWEKIKDPVRFGKSYPQHKGSYALEKRQRFSLN